MQTFNERCADAMNAPPEYVSEDFDCITKTCPKCGALAEIPDCVKCGYVFGTALPTHVDSGACIEPNADVNEQVIPENLLCDQILCSGFGQYHTDKDRIDSNGVFRKGKPFSKTTLNVVLKMIEKPPGVVKENAQWAIFSDLPSRESEKQRANGKYYAVWCDFDEHTELQAIKDVLAYLFCFYAIYSSRSSTIDKQKWRVIIPLAIIANANEYQQIAQIINDKFETAGIVPDRASERVSQICYLPNKGEFYQFYIEYNKANDYETLNWKETLSAELIEKQNQAQAEKQRIERVKEQSCIKASERIATGKHSPMDAFKWAYPVEQCLELYGYKRVGNKWLSPNSESGNAGVSIKGDKWISSHGSDAGIGKPCSGGGFFGDAFDLFTWYEHSGNYDAAIKAAGAMFTANGKTITQANQQAYREQNSAAYGVDSFISQVRDDFISHSDRDNPQGHTDNENVISSQSTPVLTTPTFKTLSLRDLLNRKYITNWLVKGIIEQGNLGLFFGDSASGKTFYIMDMCFCIAAGIDFKGKATKQGNVLYICGEGFSGLQKRFMALYQHYGVMPENLHLSEQPAAFMDISSAAAVMQKIEEIGNVSLIVIDTFHRNMGGGSEDSAEDIGTFLKNVDGFLKPTGAAVAIIHHSGHGEKGRSRGSSSIKAAMDVEYQITKDQLTNRVTVTNTKMKDWQAPPPACFNMNVVDLLDDDNQLLSDEDGEPLTSVILEPAEPTTSKSKALSGRQQDVLMELHKAIEQHGIPPTDDIKKLFPDSPQKIPDKVVHSDKWRELAYKVIEADTQDAKKKAFQRCTSALKTVYKIGFHDDYYWII